MLSEQHVLVVDGISETEEVLKTVLEPRGFHVNRILSSNSTEAPEKSSAPNVVILHEENLDSCSQKNSSWNHCSKVIIGRAELPQRSPSMTDGNKLDGNSKYLPAPFQYKELIGAIENLLKK